TRPRRAYRDRHCGHEVSEQVDEQDLPSAERRAPGDRTDRDCESDLAEIPTEKNRERVAYGCPHRATLDDRVDDRLQTVVGDDKISGMACGRRASLAECDADV